MATWGAWWTATTRGPWIRLFPLCDLLCFLVHLPGRWNSIHWRHIFRPRCMISGSTSGRLLLERSETRRRGCLRSPGQELPKTIISIYALAIRTSRCASSYLRCVSFPCHTTTAEPDIDLPASRPSIGIEFCPVARSDDGRTAFCSHGAGHSMRPPFPLIVLLCARAVTRPRRTPGNLFRDFAPTRQTKR